MAYWQLATGCWLLAPGCPHQGNLLKAEKMNRPDQHLICAKFISLDTHTQTHTRAGKGRARAAAGAGAGPTRAARTKPNGMENRNNNFAFQPRSLWQQSKNNELRVACTWKTSGRVLVSFKIKGAPALPFSLAGPPLRRGTGPNTS